MRGLIHIRWCGALEIRRIYTLHSARRNKIGTNIDEHMNVWNDDIQKFVYDETDRIGKVTFQNKLFSLNVSIS